ncbi:MAG: hypothetical protein ACKVPX_06900 [Myxococcaceae bacterium]
MTSIPRPPAAEGLAINTRVPEDAGLGDPAVPGEAPFTSSHFSARDAHAGIGSSVPVSSELPGVEGTFAARALLNRAEPERLAHAFPTAGAAAIEQSAGASVPAPRARIGEKTGLLHLSEASKRYLAENGIRVVVNPSHLYFDKERKVLALPAAGDDDEMYVQTLRDGTFKDVTPPPPLAFEHEKEVLTYGFHYRLPRQDDLDFLKRNGITVAGVSDLRTLNLLGRLPQPYYDSSRKVLFVGRPGPQADQFLADAVGQLRSGQAPRAAPPLDMREASLGQASGR